LGGALRFYFVYSDIGIIAASFRTEELLGKKRSMERDNEIDNSIK